MANSYFKKANGGRTILIDRLTLAWCELSRNAQYDAEDEVLKHLDNSILADEAFDAKNKVADVKLLNTTIPKHYALQLIGEDFNFYLEMKPYKDKKSGKYKHRFVLLNRTSEDEI